jgi:hypothetical protein
MPGVLSQDIRRPFREDAERYQVFLVLTEFVVCAKTIHE